MEQYLRICLLGAAYLGRDYAGLPQVQFRVAADRSTSYCQVPVGISEETLLPVHWIPALFFCRRRFHSFAYHGDFSQLTPLLMSLIHTPSG